MPAAIVPQNGEDRLKPAQPASAPSEARLRNARRLVMGVRNCGSFLL